jgi:hypothetical protein
LEIDLGGTQAGQFDQLQVAGEVSINGTLEVSTIDGFDPATGQTFDIITADSVTGTFSNVVVPAGTNLEVVYTNSTVSLQVSSGGLLGDANLDGMVDFADIPAFIDLLIGGSYLFEADINQDSFVNFGDIDPFITVLLSQ